jgi:hypothetical protein
MLKLPVLIGICVCIIRMATEDSKDILKNVDWKTVGGSVTTESEPTDYQEASPKENQTSS